MKYLRDKFEVGKVADICDQFDLVLLRAEFKKLGLGSCSRKKRPELTLGILEFYNSKLVERKNLDIFEPEVKTEISEPEVKTEISEPEVKTEKSEPEVKVSGNYQSRGWCYTLNNWTMEEFENLVEQNCRFHCIGKEIGKNGTPHLQGYIEFNNRGKRLGGVKKINKRAHWEARRGTPEEAFVYCKKDGDFWTCGELPSQGQRKDLENLAEQIKNGTTVNDICLENPILFHQYGRTLQKLEDLRMRKKFRSEMTKGIWYFGKTGVGKSHLAFDGFSPETHYVLPNDNGWWDGYEQQETVVINEYRGSLPYGYLLSLVDKWPVHVKRRNREPMPFLSKKIIITSSMRPEEVYHNLAEKEDGEDKIRKVEDSMDQLYRRFDVFEVLENGILQECQRQKIIEPNVGNVGNFLSQKCSEGNTDSELFSGNDLKIDDCVFDEKAMFGDFDF